MKKLTLFCLLFCLLACQKKDKVLLEFNPPLNASYRMVQIVKEVITLSDAMGDHQFEITSNTGYRFQVVEKQEFTSTLDVNFESFKLKIKTPTTNFQYNSKKSEEQSSPLAVFYQKLLGQKFKLIIKRNGKVLTVSGLDNWMAAILDSLGLNDDELRRKIINSFNQFYAEKMLRHSFDRIFHVLPPEPIALTESWEATEKEATNYFPIQKNVKWTCTDLSHTKVTLEGYSKFATTDSISLLEQLNIQGKYHFWGIETSNYEIDPQTGWILSAKRLLYLKSRTSVSGPGSKNNPLEVPVKIQRQIRFLPLSAIQ